ncbi:hypothetical protein Peur_009911 [Populus x canadensis]
MQGMDSMSLKGALDDHAKLNTRDLGDGSSTKRKNWYVVIFSLITASIKTPKQEMSCVSLEGDLDDHAKLNANGVLYFVVILSLCTALCAKAGCDYTKRDFEITFHKLPFLSAIFQC